METKIEVENDIREFYNAYFRSHLKVIIKQNHRFKIQSADKILDLLHKSAIKADAEIGIIYSYKGWIITGNESELIKIPEILKIFKKLYRHSRYDRKYDFE